ncbi:MAG TPA: M67 family metallopeptidase [Terriglobales bacterium]|nr:M67 family metallopeptidase [Terriglobales bacterium]
MLKLPKKIAEELRAHAERVYPEECCGVLLGTNAGEERAVQEARACANWDASPRRRYAIAPQDLVRAQREARERGLAIVGFYHSHPDHAAAPSATDSKEAYWDGCSYVIVETQAGRAGELRSYVLRDGQFAEEPVR